MTNHKALKFICPQCKSDQQIEVHVDNVKMTMTIDVFDDGKIKYGYPEWLESTNNHYSCHRCGWELPIIPNSYDDDILIEWLENQEYNRGEK